VNIFQSIILGIVQGLTEFLPVSSSAHLVIFEKLLNVEAHTLVFEVMVHLGTLAAVVLYFRKKLVRLILAFLRAPFNREEPASRDDLRLAWFLILATIPAGVVGLFFKRYIERAFADPQWAAGMLLITAAVLMLTRWAKERNGSINLPRAIAIGIAQSIAIMPGISRSGSTISTGMFTGLEKAEAAEFSFLLSVPAIAGAAFIEIPDFVRSLAQGSTVLVYLVGASIAGLVGYLSIAYLLSVIRRGRFFYFGVYCVVVGILGLLFL
jgi:undecaprenyl-diphosphatase